MDSSYDLIGETIIVTMDKELDHHNAVQIKEMVDKYIYGNKVRNVVFDFENTDFMDSSGIGVIMGRFKLVTAIGGRVVVINVNNNVDRIIKLSGLYKLVAKYDNLEDAIESMM